MSTVFSFKTAVWFLLIATVLSLFLTACRPPTSDGGIDMADTTEKERETYLTGYLRDTYGIECTVSPVEKRQIDTFRSEDDYYSVVTTAEGECFSVWIDSKGEVIDTYFTLQMKKSVDALLEDKLSGWKITSLRSEWLFFEKPAKKWSLDEAEAMLKSEDIEFFIYAFCVDPAAVPDEEVKARLSDISGIVYVYGCETDPMAAVADICHDYKKEIILE